MESYSLEVSNWYVHGLCQKKEKRKNNLKNNNNNNSQKKKGRSMSGWRRIRPSTGTKGPKPEKQMRNFSLAHARNEEMTTFSDRCSYT